MTIQLGNFARDKITGFRGFVTARVEYLTGCTQYCLSPKIGKDGKIPEGHYFDEQRIAVISAGVAKGFEPVKSGGPQADAPRPR